jgi:uncharacterized membrane protein YbhN (UPF0104 family)
MLLVPVVVLGLLVWATDPRELAARLGSADPGWLALGLGLLWGQTALSALRWRVTAGALGQDIPAGLALREYFVAQLVNQVMPGGVTGDALRAHRAREAAGGLWPALGAVALERLAGQVFMLAALAVGLVLGSRLDWPPGLRAVALAAVAAAALVLAVALVARRPRWLAAAGAGLRRGVLAPAVLPVQGILGLVIVTLNLAAFAAAARATGTLLSPVEVLALVPLILTAMLVPFGLAGWGWREGAAAALFPLAGATAAAGIAAAAAFGGLILISSLPGLIWLMRAPRPLPLLGEH